jgi:large subunit ribosomal protein L9
MATKLLLLEDVGNWRSGEIINVKPGYARNYLIPKKLAVPANRAVLNLQKRLQETRQQKALVDKTEAEEVANRLQGVVLISIVKVDHEGHMYGSVNVADIIQLLEEQQQVTMDKKSIPLKHAIKAIGIHEIPIKLKEGITASFHLKVITEEDHRLMTQEIPSS